MPHITEDFFTQHIPHWEASFFDELAWNPEGPRRVVEIGSFEGRSTLRFLDHLPRHAESRITCIDALAGGAEPTAAQTQGP